MLLQMGDLIVKALLLVGASGLLPLLLVLLELLLEVGDILAQRHALLVLLDSGQKIRDLTVLEEMLVQKLIDDFWWEIHGDTVCRGSDMCISEYACEGIGDSLRLRLLYWGLRCLRCLRCLLSWGCGAKWVGGRHGRGARLLEMAFAEDQVESVETLFLDLCQAGQLGKSVRLPCEEVEMYASRDIC
jgi:hypothetical protein